MANTENYGFDTNALHAGWTPDDFSHSTSVPIYLTNAYAFDSTEHARRLFSLEEGGNIYTRLSNPTTDVFEQRYAALEGGVGALASSSGHASIYMTAMTLAAQGDNFVSSSCIYGGAINMFGNTLRRSGIEVRFAHPLKPADFEAQIDDRTRFIFAETVGNPTCDVTDIRALAAIAHRHSIPLIMDSTFTTAALIKPFELGADIVILSTTKYIGGHGAVMGGITVDSGNFDWAASGKFPEFSAPDPSYHGVNFQEVFGRAAFITKLRVCTMRDMGMTPSPVNSFAFISGLETLSMRMERHCANAKAVCEYLENSPQVEKMRTPYSKSSPYYALAQEILPKGCGGVLSFDIAGGRACGGRFIDALKLIANVANLGDARTIISHPASTTHSQLSDEQLAASGIAAGTIRLSLGLENVGDVIADLDQAFAAVK